MGVISVRLNKNEETILKYLTILFNKDRSSVIKETLIEKYEDLHDLEAIRGFEKAEGGGKTSFVSAQNILDDV